MSHFENMSWIFMRTTASSCSLDAKREINKEAGTFSGSREWKSSQPNARLRRKKKMWRWHWIKMCLIQFLNLWVFLSLRARAGLWEQVDAYGIMGNEKWLCKHHLNQSRPIEFSKSYSSLQLPTSGEMLTPSYASFCARPKAFSASNANNFVPFISLQLQRGFHLKVHRSRVGQWFALNAKTTRSWIVNRP